LDISISITPEICIEVKSTGNSYYELEFKKALYFRVGAMKVWLCNEESKMTFYKKKEELIESLFVPNFPKQIKR
jgi:Uma2 family endonuclease